MKIYFGILIEKYEGDFPFWIAPVQVELILEGEEFEDYGLSIKNELQSKNVRCEIDESPNNFQNKIYRADDLKIPFVVTIGKEEYLNNGVNVRTKDKSAFEKKDAFFKEVLNCQTQF